MLEPNAPEGGWRTWFLSHPHQRLRLPSQRAKEWAAIYSEGKNPPPMANGDYEILEVWWNPPELKAYAGFDGGQRSWVSVSGDEPDSVWDGAMTELFESVLGPAATPKPTEPAGFGWDDFDWSK